MPLIKYYKKRRGLKPKKSFKNINHKFPLITIVTVVLNDVRFIEKTIQSVLNQTYQNIEYIIIDGGSTDGTLNIIRKYEKFLDFWVTEKDKGIYHAMNKGRKIAKGKWINFMNSGDTFYSKDTIKSITFTNFQNSSIIYGKARLFNESRKLIKILKPFICNKFNLALLGGANICHQAVFYNADIKFRFPDEFKICGDLFSYFHYINYRPSKYIDNIICNYYLGGVSKNNNKSKSERQTILRKQVGKWAIFLYYPINLYVLIKKYFEKK